jgi:hypothetical protein
MLSFAVRRLGHDAVISDGSHEQLFGIDAIVLEPADEGALELASWTREHLAAVAILCTSIFPPWRATEALRPDAYLVKPFALHQLEHALAEALVRQLEQV